LLAWGPLAIPVLRAAAADPDNGAVAQRAARCLEFLDGNSSSALPAAAIRLLARRKPAGATEALLAYLPFAGDEMILKEIHGALAVVGFREGKPETALVQALDDAVALRRVMAAELLAGGIEHREAVRRLLRDPRPLVRLRVALAMGTARSEDAIPILITLLGELPPDQARPAEEFLVTLASDQAPKAPLGTDEASRRKCRDAWAAWWSKAEGAALLEEFRKRTLTDSQRDQIVDLVRRLGDESFPAREKATAAILKIGRPAVFVLRQAVNDPDAEISQRAQKCLLALGKGGAPQAPAVAARLLALRKPPGAAEVLLGYCPYAEDETTAQEVQDALAALAMPDGKPAPALLRALDDKVAPRRAAAAEALAQAGGPELRGMLHRLLGDEDRMVRLRTASALASAADRAAVPVLIALLTELPPDQTWRAEDCLYRIIGERAPKVTLGTDAASRQKCRDAWTAWWRDHGSKVELVKLDTSHRMLGYTLVVKMENDGTGQVVELGPGGKQRWRITNLQFPVDAQVLPGDRVLITEYNAMRVTERDLQGKIVWERAVQTGQPVNARRLPNGNTFIATSNQLLEVDRAGKEVLSINRNNGDILSAAKTRTGQIVCLTSMGTCIWLDATGREVKSFAVGNANYTSGLDVLPNGRVLVPLFGNSKVVEFDPDGKSVWEASVQRPNSVTRLPNGHTLAASYNSMILVELDRSGKVVWEFKDGSRPWRAWRR
jgi:HEAT repeat protein